MRKEQLSKRLQMIYECLIKSNYLADIGADHAYIPIVALKQGLVIRAIASDINQPPLDMAAEHIQEAGMQQTIELRLSNGFESYQPQELEQVIIAGMGGLLIREILKEGLAHSVPKLTYCQRLVLQPMNHQDDLRIWLAEQGWQLLEENILYEAGHYYQVMVCLPQRNCSQQTNLSWLQTFFGSLNLQKRSMDLLSMLEREQELRLRALKGIDEAFVTDRIIKQKEKLIKELREIEDYLQN